MSLDTAQEGDAGGATRPARAATADSDDDTQGGPSLMERLTGACQTLPPPSSSTGGPCSGLCFPIGSTSLTCVWRSLHNRVPCPGSSLEVPRDASPLSGRCDAPAKPDNLQPFILPYLPLFSPPSFSKPLSAPPSLNWLRPSVSWARAPLACAPFPCLRPLSRTAQLSAQCLVKRLSTYCNWGLQGPPSWLGHMLRSGMNP